MQKKKLKKWEKIFIIMSIIIIFIIIGIYAYRLVFYYKKTNIIPENAKLKDVITNQVNIVYSGDGLYKIDDYNYYYMGKEVSNYLYYSGRMWRIISIDDIGIKIITDNSESSLVWGNNTNYLESNVYKWLNEDKFLNSISNNDKIVSTKWCNTAIDINDYKCETTTEAKVGLLTIDEYIKSGGVNSYLNNETYFWTLNTDTNNKAYYVHSEGGINNEVSMDTLFYSYGIRPVIYIDNNTPFLSGKGTIEDPYIIDNNQEIMINNHSVGSYLTYQNYTWRIMEITDNYTLLVLDGYIEDNDKKPIKLSYAKSLNYLNNEFLNTLKKDNLVKFDYNITEYNNTSSYNYQKAKEKQTNYVTLPKVGDLFINDYSGNWLNSYDSIKEKLIYTTSKENTLFADLSSSENYLRPIIAISNGLIIASGDGTKNKPYIVGDTK